MYPTTLVNSASHPSGVAGIKAGHVHLCRVAGMCDPIWQVMSRSCEMGFLYKPAITPLTFLNLYQVHQFIKGTQN